MLCKFKIRKQIYGSLHPCINSDFMNLHHNESWFYLHYDLSRPCNSVKLMRKLSQSVLNKQLLLCNYDYRVIVTLLWYHVPPPSIQVPRCMRFIVWLKNDIQTRKFHLVKNADNFLLNLIYKVWHFFYVKKFLKCDNLTMVTGSCYSTGNPETQSHHPMAPAWWHSFCLGKR